MAEPAHAPTFPDTLWPPGFEPPEPHPVTGLLLSFVKAAAREAAEAKLAELQARIRTMPRGPDG